MISNYKNKRLYKSLTEKIILEDRGDRMWDGCACVYLKLLLDMCKNDKELKYKNTILLFSGLEQILIYRKNTKNTLNILLLDNYFKNAPYRCTKENGIFIPNEKTGYEFIYSRFNKLL